ncbi:IS5 family transposase [Adhaeribacter pallidiroseus]|uniref:Putative transposase for transposon Tn903 n=1 Tax=Adhaeribacter pallidiroseus TaxID=2072847 RepID=A0A369QIF9_9BACT|nr:IS5 family transposase [Adhaeribacter pallidiroseus]RDC62659.1 putative transposase for transposon Tn903 [Adhaeribacter pallidiroseus]RDC63679.1 putative transposase for transposon Tn903 [Adhaeribacter pallidiroseus]RDC64928.1 putative transposase for transposon Tn903 [Adhaeribacter pallidiroseus]RDC65759.1 putative transposase for transposon Tn903 [Adhaeribacter pallidiroseus]
MLPSPTIPAKDRYKVKNWKAYTSSLVQRGSLTLWLEDSVLRAWREIDPSQKVVGECLYADCVIQCCLLLGQVYHQPLRQTTGFVSSLLAMLGYKDYAVPDYTTLCRRQSCLPVEVSKALARNRKLAIALDSTGLKVYGEGEWKVRKHGASKHRTWRKLHIGIAVDTQEIVFVALTTNGEDDAVVAGKLLQGKTAQLSSFIGDGAYDDFKLRELLAGGIKQIIPPSKDAVVHKGTQKKPVPEYLRQRNEAVEYRQEHDRKAWKIQAGYHRRSLNEVAMFRYKTTFSAQMRTRKIENQKTEVELKCKILNIYRHQGMPLAYLVA